MEKDNVLIQILNFTKEIEEILLQLVDNEGNLNDLILEAKELSYIDNNLFNKLHTLRKIRNKLCHDQLPLSAQEIDEGMELGPVIIEKLKSIKKENSLKPNKSIAPKYFDDFDNFFNDFDNFFDDFDDSFNDLDNFNCNSNQFKRHTFIDNSITINNSQTIINNSVVRNNSQSIIKSGNQTIIKNGNQTIIKNGNQTFVKYDEDD